MRKKLIGLFIIMMLITTALPVTGSLEEREQKSTEKKEKTIYASNLEEIGLLFGFIKFDGVVKHVERYGNNFAVTWEPVKNVTVIGIDITIDYYLNVELEFYMKTFTDAAWVDGNTHHILWVSDQYQHFSYFVAFPFNGFSVHF